MQRTEEAFRLAGVVAEHCRLCSGARRGVQIRCMVEACPLRRARAFRDMIPADVILREIRHKCTYCMGGQRKLVRECSQRDCLLWPYRDRQALTEERTHGKQDH